MAMTAGQTSWNHVMGSCFIPSSTSSMSSVNISFNGPAAQSATAAPLNINFMNAPVFHTNPASTFVNYNDYNPNALGYGAGLMGAQPQPLPVGPNVLANAMPSPRNFKDDESSPASEVQESSTNNSSPFDAHFPNNGVTNTVPNAINGLKPDGIKNNMQPSLDSPGWAFATTQYPTTSSDPSPYSSTFMNTVAQSYHNPYYPSHLDMNMISPGMLGGFRQPTGLSMAANGGLLPGSSIDMDCKIPTRRGGIGKEYKTGPGTNNVRVRTANKYRSVYPEHIRGILEEEFLRGNFLQSSKKAELAGRLDMTERQIKIWFQNRRAKQRKAEKHNEQAMKLQNHGHY